MPERRYQPRIGNILDAKRHLFIGLFPYKKHLIRIKFKKKEKIPSLLEIMQEHHSNSLSHTFEVAYIATELAMDYFLDLKSKLNYTSKQYQEEFVPLIEAVFQESLLHDIGKIGVPINILDREGALTKNERHLLHLHGEIGSEIIKTVGLKNLAYVGYEHHLGNSQNNGWTQKDLNLRHPLIEFISMADLIAGGLDPRRRYHHPEKIKNLLEIINEKHYGGVFSRGLINSFSRTIVKDNQYPPYTIDTFLRNRNIMHLFNKFKVADILIKNMS